MNRVAFASIATSKFVATSQHYMNGHVLDVGCGAMPYKRLFLGNPACGVTEWTGIDKRAVGDKQMDAHKLDFADGTFDTVLCTNVLNYCEFPPRVLAECARVLKVGGHLLVSALNVCEDDEEVLWGVKTVGLGSSLEAAGLNILDINKHGGLMRDEASNYYQRDKYGSAESPMVNAWADALDDAYPCLISAIALKE